MYVVILDGNDDTTMEEDVTVVVAYRVLLMLPGGEVEGLAMLIEVVFDRINEVILRLGELLGEIVEEKAVVIAILEEVSSTDVVRLVAGVVV